MKVLQIAAHMGAGAGKAISGIALADDFYEHKIVLTQKPDKPEHIDRCVRNGIDVLICPDDKALAYEISAADVVIVNWWHHPAMYRILLKLSEIPSRIVLWSHVNGLHYPMLHMSFLKTFDACMFTSKASLQNPHWTEMEREYIKENGTLVYGMGDFEPKAFTPKKDYELHEKIKIGYVGSLDYAKLHPNVIEWLKEAAGIEDHIQFFLAGDCLKEIADDVLRAGLSDKVHFLGFRRDIPELLKSFDIFIYPLNPFNFATTENALLEAMAAGLPIITSDGIVESNIIDHGQNGILVSDGASFKRELSRLLQDAKLRTRLGENARNSVMTTYNIEENVSQFCAAVKIAMKNPKKKHDFSGCVGKTPYEWFLTGCGQKEQRLFEKAEACVYGTDEWNDCIKEIKGLEQIFKGEAKGSAMQFYSLYQEDNRLGKITAMIENAKEKRI